MRLTRVRLPLLAALASACAVVAATTVGNSAASAPKTLDWPHYGNDLGGMRYQDVDQITTKNVTQLAPAWIFHTNVMNDDTSFEAQPIVVNGVVFIASPHDHVFAVDGQTGKPKWTYNPTDMPPLFQLALCCGQTSRGVAVGGGSVFLARMDDVLVSLDAKTGKVRWKTRLANWHEKYAENMAPQYVNGLVLVGSSGGEYEKRGFIAAYDAKSGRQVWRFWTTQPGTWGGNAWKTGGADVWVTPEVDPKLGLVYVHTGNASPDVNGSKRQGKDLYTTSILALSLKTGALRWHFQEVHHDLWDYDSAQPAQLYTVVRNGTSIPVIGHANKDGFYFELDRRTGKPVLPVTERKVPTSPSWQHPYPTQPTTNTVLIPQTVTGNVLGVQNAKMWTPPQQTPLLEQPGAEMSGPEWTPGAYSPRTHYAYIPAGGYSPWVYHATPKQVDTYGSTGSPPQVVAQGNINSYGLFDAVNTQTGKIAWRTRTAAVADSGVAIGGDLVFWGHDDGTFVAQNAKTGKVLWTWHSNLPGIGGANGAAAVYVAGGHEYVVAPFGGSAHIRGDTGPSVSPLGDALIAFSLPAGHTDTLPNITADPVQVPVAAPANYQDVSYPPQSAKVVPIDTHDFNYYPRRFTVRAGQLVAIQLTNTGLLPAGLAVNLPTEAVGLATPVPPDKQAYLVFTAPAKPGNYAFFDSVQPDKYYAPNGVMHVTKR